MITHLGALTRDIDVSQAAHENRILACLRKRGRLRENEVKLYTAASRSVGREAHNRAVQNLVKRGLIRKLTTNRRNSFWLELTGPDIGPGSPCAPGVAVESMRGGYGTSRLTARKM